MKPLECPECHSSDLESMKKQVWYVWINEDTGVQHDATAIYVKCKECNEKFYALKDQWNEHMETFL